MFDILKKYKVYVIKSQIYYKYSRKISDINLQKSQKINK